MKKNLIAGAIALALASGTAFGAAEVNTKGGFEIKDGDFSFKFAGNVMLDYVNGLEDNRPAEEIEIADNLFARRVELEFSGKVFADWTYKVEYDLAENATTAKEVFVTYTGLESSAVMVGQFKQPFGLEEVSSSKGTGFMERSLMNSAWAPSYRTGVGFRRFGDAYSLTASMYGKEMGVPNAPDPITGEPGDEPISFAARATFAPIMSDDAVLHLGVAVAAESTGDGRLVRFRARPEARPNNGALRLIDTLDMPSDRHLKTGVEAAWVTGGLSLQAEYQQVKVTLADDLTAIPFEDPSFSGYYLEARWFPGGEMRPYAASNGTFAGIKPLSIGGAWELRARLSNLDLHDGPVIGGEQDNRAVGVTYYPNSSVRVMLEYVRTDLDFPWAEDSPSFLQARFQIAF